MAARIVELVDLEAARSAKGREVLTTKVPTFLAQEVRQAAERVGMNPNQWVMAALMEKIVNDERKVAVDDMLKEGNSMRPDGVSPGLWRESMRSVIDETGKKK